MFRLARLPLGSLIAATLLQGCGAPEINAVEGDFFVGDQCFYTLAERPDDCFERAPCMWSDAYLRISQGENGAFLLEAKSGGWTVPSEAAQRTAHASAASPEALAGRLPAVLARLHQSPPEISRACVYIDPDQDMRVSDIVAFHQALIGLRIHKIGLFAVIVDDPIRFGEITLGQRNDAAFFQRMRRYADEQGYTFSQHEWEGDTHFQIFGDGLAITASRFGAPARASTFRVMLELSLQADGTPPTESMMDQLTESFAAVVEGEEGASLSLREPSK